MNLIRKFSCVLMLFLCFMVFMVLNVMAAESERLPGESVYETQEKQEELSNLLKSDANILNSLKAHKNLIIKESITPVYYIDPIEYLEKGQLILHPVSYRENSDHRYETIYENQDIETNLYVAKGITYGMSRGNNYIFQIDSDGKVFGFGSFGEGNCSKVSFADHKNRIEELLKPLGVETVEPDNVRYVKIAGSQKGEFDFDYGSAFYFDNGEIKALIDVHGYTLLFNENEYLLESELKDAFSFLKEKRELETEYLEKYKFNKDIFLSEYINVSRYGEYYFDSQEKIIHITHISEYLENGDYIGEMPTSNRLVGNVEADATDDTDVTLDSIPQNNDESKMHTNYILLTILLFAVIVSLVVFAIKKKKD